LVILVVTLLLYYFIDSKKRKKLNELLLKQNTKITEQRIEIAKQNDYLLESNKTKDRLFQIIAHDLRSPLVSMESITQLIPYWVEEQDFESLSRLSKTLELSVNNVLSLIDNLLNWALNQQGKFPYKPENINLKDNLSETIDVYRPIAQIKNIELKFKPLNNVLVFADKNMIFTVMRNLLNNAVKFTPENGEIIVGIERNQQFAKVWVKDSGIGMPVGKKEEVFELANGNTKGTKGETGKGLGLFFCKEFVSMNNGDIYIESEKGKGTTITFTLPLFNIAEN
jgi:signal transduction histidine kinase